jgi:hypothetical protein
MMLSASAVCVVCIVETGVTAIFRRTRTEKIPGRMHTSIGPRATRSYTSCTVFLAGKVNVAPVTREVLGKAEPDSQRRPAIHAGV